MADPELDLESDPEPDPDPLVEGTDMGIRIRTKMSRIPNTALCISIQLVWKWQDATADL